MNNVYLIPCGDRAYYASISEAPPTPDAIFLVEEGPYPVELWWSRHDLNMEHFWCSEFFENREELIEKLNFLGLCGHNVELLWDYNDRMTTNEAISRLFDVCYIRKEEEIMAAFEDAIRDM